MQVLKMCCLESWEFARIYFIGQRILLPFVCTTLFKQKNNVSDYLCWPKESLKKLPIQKKTF